MSMRCVLLTLSLVACFPAIFAQSEGEFCSANGKQGVCVYIHYCDEVLANVRNPSYTIKNCGFVGKTPIVCCVTPHALTFKKCLEYQLSSELHPDPPGIIGGIPAQMKEFPHMVALAYGEDDKKLQWLCGGSLISTNYVLTAAHCLTTESQHGPLRKVLAGTINKQKPEEGGKPQIFGVKKAIAHPDYKKGKKYHDIGLVELSENAFFTSYVTPICLHQNPQLPNFPFTASGFGKNENGVVTSDLLYKVDLVQYNNTYCNEMYETNRQIPDGIREKDQICAGSATTKAKDTCQGDSGGPLHYKTKIFTYLVGITSFGLACGLENVPGIYTRVSNYLSWIESNVWD